jgi:hypothetical protein
LIKKVLGVVPGLHSRRFICDIDDGHFVFRLLNCSRHRSWNGGVVVDVIRTLICFYVTSWSCSLLVL